MLLLRTLEMEMLVRRGGLKSKRCGSRRHSWVAVALAFLIGVLAEPAAATSFRGDLQRLRDNRQEALLLLLQSQAGRGRFAHFDLRDLLLGLEELRITGLPLPGDDAGTSLPRSFQRHRGLRLPGRGFFSTGSPGGGTGTSSVPEPATLALVLAGLIAAASLAHRKITR